YRFSFLRARTPIWSVDLYAIAESARASIDEGNLRAHLRNLQDVPHHARKIHSGPLDFHCDYRDRILRRSSSSARTSSRSYAADDFAFQSGWHRRKLWRRVVWH